MEKQLSASGNLSEGRRSKPYTILYRQIPPVYIGNVPHPPVDGMLYIPQQLFDARSGKSIQNVKRFVIKMEVSEHIQPELDGVRQPCNVVCFPNRVAEALYAGAHSRHAVFF